LFYYIIILNHIILTKLNVPIKLLTISRGGFQIVSGIGSRQALIVETVLITNQGEGSDHVIVMF